MVSPDVANPGFVLWSESLFLWTAAAYGVTADPLEGETAHLSWRRWGFLLASRVVLVTAFLYIVELDCIVWFVAAGYSPTTASSLPCAGALAGRV